MYNTFLKMYLGIEDSHKKGFRPYMRQQHAPNPTPEQRLLAAFWYQSLIKIHKHNPVLAMTFFFGFRQWLSQMIATYLAFKRYYLSLITNNYPKPLLSKPHIEHKKKLSPSELKHIISSTSQFAFACYFTQCIDFSQGTQDLYYKSQEKISLHKIRSKQFSKSANLPLGIIDHIKSIVDREAFFCSASRQNVQSVKSIFVGLVNYALGNGWEQSFNNYRESNKEYLKQIYQWRQYCIHQLSECNDVQGTMHIFDNPTPPKIGLKRKLENSCQFGFK